MIFKKLIVVIEKLLNTNKFILLHKTKIIKLYRCITK